MARGGGAEGAPPCAAQLHVLTRPLRPDRGHQRAGTWAGKGTVMGICESHCGGAHTSGGEWKCDWRVGRGSAGAAGAIGVFAVTDGRSLVGRSCLFSVFLIYLRMHEHDGWLWGDGATGEGG